MLGRSTAGRGPGGGGVGTGGVGGSVGGSGDGGGNGDGGGVGASGIAPLVLFPVGSALRVIAGTERKPHFDGFLFVLYTQTRQPAVAAHALQQSVALVKLKSVFRLP